nr:immunoglobulin light chain junction region [Macaca mulatta]MOX24266.1 immunoglobulin light chain junction region [Macaca mulatta]MOX24910.1 immunoglobulin light chain junction region [Macaca mulatta]MOX24946.1 immunoglobulin light chain junction region [Macaca mulatta]MOX25227.1 immunoglobulin light chain junction region [Macaca mulatta]
CQQDYDPPFSF